MKNLIKAVLITFLVLVSATKANAQDRREVLIVTQDLAPYTTQVTGPGHSGLIEIGNFIQEVGDRIQSSKHANITYFIPLMKDMHEHLEANGMEATNIFLHVPMVFGENGSPTEVEVQLYKGVTANGINIVAVGEPLGSGLFEKINGLEVYQTNNKELLEKEKFFCTAALEYAKFKGDSYFQAIQSFGGNTALLPVYKKYWGRYSGLEAKVIASLTSNDHAFLNAKVPITEEIKKILQLDDQFYNPLAIGSIVDNNNISFKKAITEADHKPGFFHTNDAKSAANTYIKIYDELPENQNTNVLIENIRKVRDKSAYIKEHYSQYRNEKFLKELISRAEDINTPFGDAITYKSLLKEILNVNNGTFAPISSEIKSKVNLLRDIISSNVAEKRRQNIMDYLKTKGLSNEDKVIKFFAANHKEIGAGKDVSRLWAARDEMLLITAMYFFTFIDNGAFTSPKSYKMFMGTESYQGIDGALGILDDNKLYPIYRLYLDISLVLVITNPQNQDATKYYDEPEGLQKGVKTFKNIIQATSLGKSIKNAVTGTDTHMAKKSNMIDRVYQNYVLDSKSLEKILPQKSAAIESLETIKGLKFFEK